MFYTLKMTLSGSESLPGHCPRPRVIGTGCASFASFTPLAIIIPPLRLSWLQPWPVILSMYEEDTQILFCLQYYQIKLLWHCYLLYNIWLLQFCYFLCAYIYFHNLSNCLRICCLFEEIYWEMRNLLLAQSQYTEWVMYTSYLYYNLFSLLFDNY